ncbi:MAG: SDR family oxidoreductase [Gammaproteobacteria bacterium]|nr:SDR family oxidoreductase [Gammaproteobacteria bacterium]
MNPDERILVTGATGLIGGALIARLLLDGVGSVRATVRGLAGGLSAAVEVKPIGDLGPATDWSRALGDVTAVVHTAARVHVMREQAADPLAVYRRDNVEGTLQLARQAAESGVRRFVFLSSIKVNGEETLPGRPCRAADAPRPEDAYGISKLEAEQGLMNLAQEAGMEVVILRPPLVYGPGVKGNFAALIKALARGLPLPLGAITDNRRSLVGLDNLVDLIRVCLEHPAAANQVFLAGDGEDLSTAELLRRLGQALGRPARLIPVPPALMKAGARALGREGVCRRLCGSLQVDIAPTCERLDWTPPLGVDEALARTVRG